MKKKGNREKMKQQEKGTIEMEKSSAFRAGVTERLFCFFFLKNLILYKYENLILIKYNLILLAAQ